MARVLIADDDLDFLAAFQAGLAALGNEVTGVSAAVDVLKKLENSTFDIVFLDLVMKGGGAITLIHDIRREYSDIPIVVISGRSELFNTPVFNEGLRMAQAKIKKSATIEQIQVVINRLTY